MLEIRRGKAARSYENTFFREFSKNLRSMFEKYSIDGLLIGNSSCEIAQNLMIDALLITNNNVFLIDLKNYSGEIILPNPDNDFSEGLWMTKNKVTIKGGSHINPYKQLYQQKRAFTWVYHNSTIKSEILENNEQFSPSRIKKIVCFQKPVTLVGEIPSKNELDFFITDSERYLETIKDIIDVNDDEVRLTSNSFNVFKEFFRADIFQPDENYNETEDIQTLSVEQSDNELYLDQKEAISEITSFIKSDSDNVFILKGTAKSGKSFLSSYIEDIAFSNSITQVEYFAPSGISSLNLLSDQNIEYESIYTHIYGGEPQKQILNFSDDQGNTFNFHQENDNFFDHKGNQIDPNNYIKTFLDVIPIKPNESDSKAIYIVDEAQLISNKYWQSDDIRFGSGVLLKDFIEFLNIKESSRKVIFIGDKFLLQSAKEDESALDQEYMANTFDLETSSFELIDKGEDFPLVNNSLQLVKSIRENQYNQLYFDFFENFKSIKREDSQNLINNKIHKNAEFHILSYENSNAQKINLWIKENIIKNGADITKDDLVIINNTFKLENENDPFAEPKKVYNGEFANVISSEDNVISESVSLKGAKEPIIINYKEVSLNLNRTGQQINVLSLENFRISEKGELSMNESTAIKVLLDREIQKEKKKNPFKGSDFEKKLFSSPEYKLNSNEILNLDLKLAKGEKVKTKKDKAVAKLKSITRIYEKQNRKYIEHCLNKDTSSKYYKYKNAAKLKFGWALTVHKSQSYKWDDIIFDLSSERRGRTNKSYFKWLYSGLTRAKSNIYLITYSEINPLIKIEFKENLINKSKGKSIYFQADTNSEVSLNDVPDHFNFTEGSLRPILIQLYSFIVNKVNGSKFAIKSINQSDYQSIYEFKGKEDEIAKISIYCNLKGQVRPPTLVKAAPNEFGSEVLKILRQNSKINNFDFIQENWRKNTYKGISLCLKENDFNIIQFIQTHFKDTIEISNDDETLIVDMYYDGNGFFTSVIATSFTSVGIWDYYKSTLENLSGLG